MLTLMDIAPPSRSFKIAGEEVRVTGVSAEGISRLFARFPDLGKLISGGGVDVASLLTFGGQTVSAIIAEGCGYPESPDAEKKAGSFPLDLQADFLAAILEATMPGGSGPFVAKLKAMGRILKVEDPPSLAELATRSRKRSNSSQPTGMATSTDSSPIRLDA